MTEDNMAEAELKKEEALVREIKEAFQLKNVDASQYSPLALAYIGDNVYELINRTVAVSRADQKVQKLHRECSGRANAGAQAKLVRVIEGELTEEEANVLHRGRNAEVYTKAKNATTADYHLATGLEALIGFLYLTGRYERLVKLIRDGWEKADV